MKVVLLRIDEPRGRNESPVVLLGSFSKNSSQRFSKMCFTFRQSGPSPRGLTQDGGAADADDDGLRVREHGGDLVAPGALDVHEVGVGVLHEALQLVPALLLVRARVQQVLGELQGGGPRVTTLLAAEHVNTDPKQQRPKSS
jgi:hypothetical protein